MITANFSRGESGLRMSVQGHAEYSSDGDDIVCAAVSGLVYALLGYLANEAVEFNINAFGSGVADIECSLRGEEAMKLCCIGLLQIALSYPDSLAVCGAAWRWGIAPAFHAFK